MVAIAFVSSFTSLLFSSLAKKTTVRAMTTAATTIKNKKNLLLVGDMLPPISEQLSKHDNDNNNDTENGLNLKVHPVSFMEQPMEWLKSHGPSVDYIMTNNYSGLPLEYLQACPNVQLISSNGVGYDSIPVKEAVKRNILITHTPTVLNAETSTTAIMLYLACYRDFLSCERHARSGAWETTGAAHALSRTADGRTVGILGLGRIGTSIAEKLLPFGCQVVYHSRNPKPDVPFKYYDNLLDMAKDVDCLICILPGGDGTKHIVNEQVMNALGPEGVLINVARGSVVDETAMIKALQEHRLGWAGLDVFEQEPHIPPELCVLPNVVLLPHVGSATQETRLAMGQLTLDNVLQHVKDETVFTPVPECAHYAKTTPLTLK
mmetsp:Transcript_10521/g.13942  ORF Transcript_10521/g.13942 Transcript_10521/m.13942 type:complete len:377 (-) Transcript_10521:35-1165(-)